MPLRTAPVVPPAAPPTMPPARGHGKQQRQVPPQNLLWLDALPCPSPQPPQHPRQHHLPEASPGKQQRQEPAQQSILGPTLEGIGLQLCMLVAAAA